LTLKKSYNFPSYNAVNTNKRPDQRDQLYWDPNFTISGDNKSIIEFYTSDVTGLFEIVVEGYRGNGEPVSMVMSFMVK
jgi:hypothetical protein